MKAAIYCRVSTEDQEREGTSLQTQLEACLTYCQQKGYEVARRFSETYSGLTIERPKLAELRALVRANDIDVIVVYCLDRLTRDPAHGALLMQELQDHDAKLEAATEAIETTDLGKLISYIRGFASKLEADKIRERTMRGKQARLKEGKLPQGTGIGIYGYKWDKASGKRIIIEAESKVVQQIFTDVIKGSSLNRLAIKLNNVPIPTKSGSKWFPLTLRRIVTNQTYTGKTYFGQTTRVSKTKVVAKPQQDWILLPDVTPPSISESVFNQAQEALKRARQSRPFKTNSPYLLSGMMKCPKCGSPVSGTTLNGKYRYYKCRGSVPTPTRGAICDAKYIKADEVESFVWQRFVILLSDPLTVLTILSNLNYDSRRDITPMLNKQIKQIRNKLKTYAVKEKNLYDLLIHDSVTKDYVLEAVNKLRQNQKEDERQLNLFLETNKRAETTRIVAPKLTEISDSVKHNSENYTFEQKRELLQNFQAGITALPGSYQFSCFIDAEINNCTETDKAHFTELIKDFESKHPDLTAIDVIDKAVALPDDTVFGKTVNIVNGKNLVTIERTSA